jgi:8-oxo-dGTP diphosphatase
MPSVVSCLLEYQGKILLLKRSTKVSTYKGMWGAVAGYIEPDETPFETALKEIREEAGLLSDDVSLLRKGDTAPISDLYEGKRYDWVIHPFLFEVKKKDKVHIDWEHVEYRWIDPGDIGRYETVPGLKEIVRKLVK